MGRQTWRMSYRRNYRRNVKRNQPKYAVKLWQNGKYMGKLTDLEGKKAVFGSKQEAETASGIELTQMEFAEGNWKTKVVKEG